MKKIIWSIGCLVLLLLNSILTACGGLHNSNSIHATNLITNESITIPLNVHNTAATGNFSNFSTTLNQEELMDELKGKDSVNSIDNIYQHPDVGYMRFSTDNGDFYIKYNGCKEENNKYEFNYTLFADVASINGSNEYVYFPYYMLEKYPGYDYPSSSMLSEGELVYNNSFSFDDFVDYYENKGIYTIEEAEKSESRLCLLITDKSTGYRFAIKAFNDGLFSIHAE